MSTDCTDRRDIYGRMADGFRTIIADPTATPAQKRAARKQLADAESKRGSVTLRRADR